MDRPFLSISEGYSLIRLILDQSGIDTVECWMPMAFAGVKAPVHSADMIADRFVRSTMMTIIQKGRQKLFVGVDSADQKPSMSRETGACVNRMRVVKLIRRQSAKTSMAARIAPKIWTAVWTDVRFVFTKAYRLSGRYQVETSVYNTRALSVKGMMRRTNRKCSIQEVDGVLFDETIKCLGSSRCPFCCMIEI